MEVIFRIIKNDVILVFVLYKDLLFTRYFIYIVCP